MLINKKGKLMTKTCIKLSLLSLIISILVIGCATGPRYRPAPRNATNAMQCPSCGGSGTTCKCPRCGGSGKTSVTRKVGYSGPHMSTVATSDWDRKNRERAAKNTYETTYYTCSSCGGTGTGERIGCSTCYGSGKVY
jgi:DnaJ-class molecular chaperone